MITINATGDTTLRTAGKYCPEDILIKVPEGTELPELSNEGTAADLLSGKELIDGDGNKVTGTFTIDSELSTQDDLIAQIQTALQNKASGVILPTLTNPATAENLEEGYELIDGDGNIVTGTHVCSGSGGGESGTITTVGISGFAQSTAKGSIIYAHNTGGITTGSYSLLYLSAAKKYRHALSGTLLANTPIIVLTSGTITMPSVSGFTLETIAAGTGYAVYQYSGSGSSSGGSTTCCFVAGTQILTSLDGETVSIESLKKGDDVVSYNVETGESYMAKVNSLIIKENVTDIAEVYFDNGSSLIMNAYHPIYTENGFHSLTNHKGYDTLVVGDVAKTIDGWSEIIRIERYTSEPMTVYNLDCIDIGENPDDETNDTFYANGIVVHNASIPSGPSGEC